MNNNYQLKKVLFEVTGKCNMNCIHCGSDCSYRPNGEELLTEEWLKLINDLADLGCEIITFTGGEALLRKDLSILNSACTNRGIGTAIVSNGYEVNENNIKQIKEMKFLAFGISLDAVDEYLCDYIRGKKGAFQHADNAIKLLVKNKIPVTVITTIHKLNYEQLPKIKNYLLKNGIKVWQIQYADNIGRVHKEWKITEAQYVKIIKYIDKIQNTYPKEKFCIGKVDLFGYMSDYSNKVIAKWEGCPGGLSALAISADGSVRACLSLQEDRYIEDNIRNRSIKEIWNDPNMFCINRNFDCSQLTGFCSSCKHGYICKGGCLRAATINGGRNAPYCLYRIEQEGFSSEEQSRLSFTKKELFSMYNCIRKMPKQFLLA